GDTNDLTIRTGSSYHNSNGNVYEVTDIVLHPKFNIRTFDYDVALVKVKNPIKLTVCNSRPVNLANEQYETPVGSLVYVTGWGANQTEGNDSSELLGAWIPLIDSSVCQSNYAEPGKPDRITDRMLCAGSAKGDGFCHGDYGGPLVDKNRKLIGIVSWGTHCGQSDKPGVYTKVNHPEILEFILTKSSD
ncbi:trypsin-7-like, partial [Ctenocephalides felis]